MEKSTTEERPIAATDTDVEASTPPADFAKIEPTTSIGASLTQVETNPYGSRPTCFSSTLQECLFVLTTTFAVGQSSIFSGALITMTAFIGDSLNMTAAEVTWMSAAQTLTAGAFLLFFGKVADLFGRRLLLLISLAFFTICLLIMGFATNAIYMDVFCGLCGLSSAASVPPAIGKLGSVYEKPSRRKNRAFACFSAGNPVGFAIGAFISGVAMHVSTWRTAFWATSVIYAAFTAIAWWTVPADSGENKGRFNMETFAQFDFLGAFLAIIGVALFTSALTLASDAPQGWRTSYVIALLVLGIVLMALFIYWQSVFKHPLMPLGVWRDRNFSLLVSILCLGFYGFSGNMFWLTLVWQRIHHSSPLMVAVRILPAMIGGLAVNVVAALVMHRISNKLLMIIAAVALAASSALYSAMSEYDSYWAFVFPAMLLSVLGADFQFTITNMYVMSSLPSKDQAVGGGLFNAITRITATVGIGIQTSVFTSVSSAVNGEATLKYSAYRSTFFVSTVGAALALLLLPFLTVKTQGGKRHNSNAGAERTPTVPFTPRKIVQNAKRGGEEANPEDQSEFESKYGVCSGTPMYG